MRKMRKTALSICLGRLNTIVTAGPLMAFFLALAAENTTAEEQTFVYAVQISASVQASPPQITLNWEPDPYGAMSYSVYRKGENDTSWGPATTLSGSALRFTDTDLAAGSTYEYQ